MTFPHVVPVEGPFPVLLGVGPAVEVSVPWWLPAERPEEDLQDFSFSMTCPAHRAGVIGVLATDVTCVATVVHRRQLKARQRIEDRSGDRQAGRQTDGYIDWSMDG